MDVEISKEVINPVYLPLLHDRHRYVVLYGGAGSGKSVFAVQRYLIKLMEQPGVNLLVVRAVANTHKDSTYALFRQIITQWGLEELFTCRDSDLRIACANGNAVVFRGLDDAEKLKSITFPGGELTDIWVEEASEITEGDFNQLDIRLRGGSQYKQMVLTFNPISALHWLKGRFFDKKDKRAVVLRTTYRDNGFLDKEYAKTLEEYRERDPYYYAVYCLGEWGVTGKTVFSQEKVLQRLRDLTPPEAQGTFTYETYFDPEAEQVRIAMDSIAFQACEDGPIALYRRPEEEGVYVIGGDTAGEGSDWFVGQVIDHRTGEQVCTLRHCYDEDQYAKQMFCLGVYYNMALVAIETNYSTYPVRELERLGYPRQFVRQREDSYTRRIQEAYGFRTTAVTRPLILAQLVELVREEPELIRDRITLEEMLTFVRNEKGRAQAQQGAHDDCVMALAIAYYSREQQGLPCRRSPWTEDMEEDYRRASPKEQKLLLQRWGKPL